jgi:hypothetical protein
MLFFGRPPHWGDGRILPSRQPAPHAGLTQAKPGRARTAAPPRARPRRRFRNRGTKCVSEPGIKWMGGGAKRRCGRVVPPPRRRPRAPARASRRPTTRAAARGPAARSELGWNERQSFVGGRSRKLQTRRRVRSHHRFALLRVQSTPDPRTYSVMFGIYFGIGDGTEPCADRHPAGEQECGPQPGRA